MTTLTANVPVSPDHCRHKLPTSCLLTALPTCCACQDARAHSTSYSKYIDGVGFVLQGTRQERYCWMCKEFWNARIAASGIPQSETRIPQVPDQTRFLERWFDWHRGYRIIKGEDGTEEREALLGENIADVEPGYLPRKLEEAGVTRENLVDETSEHRNRGLLQLHEPSTERFDIDPEDRIFDLDPPTTVQTTSAAQPTPSIHSSIAFASTSQPSSTPDSVTILRNEYAGDLRDQFRRVAALRHEVQRLRAGIERVMSGLHELGESVPDSQDALQHTTSLTTRLGNIEAHLSNHRDRSSNTTSMEPNTDDRTDWSPPNMSFHTPDTSTAASGGNRNSNNYSQGSGGPGVPYLGADWLQRHTPEFRTNVPQAQNSTRDQDLDITRAQSSLEVARNHEELLRAQQANGTATGQQIIGAITEAFHPRLAEAIAHREQCEREVTRLQRERHFNLFRTSREEMERAGSTYESPITGMFNAYTNRYHAIEEQRRQQRAAERTRGLENIRQDIRQELPHGPHGHSQGRIHPPREPRSLRGQHWTPTPYQPQPPRPGTAGAYTPHLSSFVRNQAGPIPEAALREQLVAAEADALAARHTAPGGIHYGPRNYPNSRPGSYHFRPAYSFDEPITSPMPPTPMTEQPFLRPVGATTDLNTFPGTQSHRAAALQHRVRRAREELGDFGNPYGSDSDEHPTRADIDRYLGAMGTFRSQREREPEPPRSLDKDDGRPDPISEEQMMVKMECKVCFGQLATIAMLPCGHCVMCKWCADEAVPSHKLDATAPASRKAQCPVCRRRVKNKVTIYGGESQGPSPPKRGGSEDGLPAS